MDKEKAFKKILVAFDNSESSRKAMQKACDIAEKFNSSITALFVTTDANKQFEDAKTFLEQFSTAKGIEVEIEEMKGGKVYEQVIKMEKSGAFQLILIGAHGKSGFIQSWIGSNAFRVVSSSNCPVITIQEHTSESTFKNIVVPLADSNTTRQKVPYAAVLAQALGATLHIFGVSKSDSNDAVNHVTAYVRQTERYFMERNIKYTVDSAFGVKVPEACIEHAKKVDAGLLLIMTETESAGVFMDSYSQQLVNTSPIPVMSIHSRDTMLTGAAGY
ncbi:universal stress protein [bacterium]|nr:universal stress protein [bacterium]